ncbi:MAG: PDZ domain-containing protein, partial [Cyanobacteria bacterium J06638_6]
MPSNQSGYYRFPTIHRDQVVFVCEDDLWSVPTAGGVASRLTANLGEVRNPVLSPDGSQIAFIGREEGDAEVYVMPAAGGNVRRLTFLGANTTVAGWSVDGASIVLASNAGQPFMRLPQLYSISAQGGLPQLLPYGMASTIAFGPNGGVVLGRNTADPAYWKRYRGGRVGVLWVDTTGDGQFEKLPDLGGNVAAPMWIGERIYFLSDHGGIGNLYSCTPAGQDLQQHTDSREYYLRNAATDGDRIVYHAGADLAYFDVAAGTHHPIAVEFHSPQVQRQRKFIDTGKYLEDYELHPEGHSTLITSRGQSVYFGHWEGAVTPLSRVELGRYRLTRWLRDGHRFVAVCDRSGRETLEILSADVDQPPIVLDGLDLGRAFTLEVSPVADQVVLTNHRHELIWVDLDSQQLKVLDHSQYGRIRGASWSPDGQWVVYSCSETQNTASIKLCRVEDGQTHCLTPPRFFDYGPTFDPEGKFIYFLSVREFNPVYDSVYFDLNFPQATRPFLIALQKDTPSPFVPMPKPLEENGKAAKAAASDDASAQEGDDADTSVTPLAIDLDGIEQRLVGFPVAEGTYRQIWGLNGKVLFSSVPIKGSLGRNWASAKPPTEAKIEIYDFATQACETVATNVTNFKVGRDRSTLIYRSGDRLRVCKAKAQPAKNGAPPKSNGDAGKADRKTGWLDLKRVRISVLPPQEWQQMLKEIWRLQQEHFWTPDLSGVDWQRVYDRYAPLLSRISSRSEFSDLVWEMQGELGTSHAYEFGGDYRKEPNYRLGSLGADFAYDEAAQAYRISHIPQGDTWTEAASPLQQLGLNLQPGDRL